MSVDDRDNGRTTEQAIDRYTPTPQRIPTDLWATIGPLARAAVRRCEGIHYDTARGYMGHAAGILAWAAGQDDVELTDEAVFCDETIERYVASTDYAAQTKRGLKAALAQMVPDQLRPAKDRISTYTPQVIEADAWEEVAPIVRDAVRRCLPLADSTVGSYLLYAARFVVWAREQGVALDARAIFTRDRVETYVDEELTEATDNYRAAIRSALRQMTLGTTPTDLSVFDPRRIGDAIVAYKPEKIDAETWSEIGELAREAVRRAAPSSRDNAIMLLRFTATYLAWCHTQPSIPLKPSAVFSDRTISRYVSRGLEASTSDARATVRSQLRKVARAHPDNTMAPKADTLRDSDGQAPYSDEDEASFFHVARTQSTPLRRRKLTAILCLGFGGGLNSHDMRWVRGSHVRRDGDGTTLVDIVDGDSPRTVVIEDRYADRLLEAAADAGDRLICGGRKAGRENAMSTILAWIEHGSDHEKLNITRMRNTWFARQMAAGTPLNLILKQAGLTSTRTIEHLVWLLPAGETPDRNRLLSRPAPRLPAGDEQEGDTWEVAS